MRDETVRCAWALERIDALVAGELEPAEETAMARHVLACPDCAAELGAAERVEAELRALPALDAPPELVARLHAIAEPPTAAQAARRPWPVALAATLAAVVAVGWWWSREPATGSLDTVEARPSAAEVMRATEEARLALAVVARLGRKARAEVRDEVLIERLAEPVLESLGGRPARAQDGTPPGGARS